MKSPLRFVLLWVVVGVVALAGGVVAWRMGVFAPRQSGAPATPATHEQEAAPAAQEQPGPELAGANTAKQLAHAGNAQDLGEATVSEAPPTPRPAKAHGKEAAKPAKPAVTVEAKVMAPVVKEVPSAANVATPKPPRIGLPPPQKVVLGADYGEGAGAASAGTAGAGAAGEGRTPLGSADYDVGVIPNDRPATAELPFRNISDTKVEIASVVSSCGCTAAQMDDSQRVLEPGAKASVRITLYPEKIHAFEGTKAITVSPKDKALKPFVMKVHLKIDPEFEMIPDKLEFGECEKGAAPEQTLLVRQLGEEPIEVQKVESTPPGAIELSFERIEEKGWRAPNRPEYLIHARLNTDLAIGKTQGNIQITTTCERMPMYTCRYAAAVNTFYQVSTAQMQLRTPKPGDERAASLRVTSTEAITVQEATISGEDLTAFTEAGENANTAVVYVGVKPEALLGRKNEQLSFVVVAGDKKVVQRVPVMGLVLDRTAQKVRPGLFTKGQPPSVTPKASAQGKGAPPNNEDILRQIGHPNSGQEPSPGSSAASSDAAQQGQAKSDSAEAAQKPAKEAAPDSAPTQ